MQKRISLLAAFAAALFPALTAGYSYAEERAANADGCAVLADVIHGEIFVSALFGSSRLPPEPGQGAALSCDQTAASASAG